MTPKRRMLNAYKGLPCDRPPVAPEFWYYFPAKLLGVDMIELEREIPLWKALQETFRHYQSEGWGVAFAETQNPHLSIETALKRIDEGSYLEIRKTRFRNHSFTAELLFSKSEPSSVKRYPVEDEEDLAAFLDMELSEENDFQFSAARDAHREVGEDYLLELWLGNPFFDLISAAMGFERAILLFMSGRDELLEGYRERYIRHQTRFLREACQRTSFESFFIGCSSSCKSLLGPSLWRRWDKPYIRAMAEELHRQDRLLHVHFHGRSLETAADFAEIGLDCVCPFERPPGGDIEGYQGLVALRALLDERVTMNGNVHTVEALIRGTPRAVREQVREIKRAFAGSRRFIIGTGDQVGRETPEENIRAMIEEAKTP